MSTRITTPNQTPEIEDAFLSSDTDSVKRSILMHLRYSIGKVPETATLRDWYNATAFAVRDRLLRRRAESEGDNFRRDSRRVYYLSMEFLIGRLLRGHLVTLELLPSCTAALEELGLDLAQIENMESEAGLGNGGLGRLAACYLDSMATLDIPGYGYGIRYEFGIFYQRIDAGAQVEQPDNWLRYQNPWELPRAERLYHVRFGGRIVDAAQGSGQSSPRWEDGQDVMAMAYDVPIPGYGTRTVNTLRLWAAKASRAFDLGFFNQGDYVRAVEEKDASESISKVLYPSDSTYQGRELRLKQEYFFASASLQDILRRFLDRHADLDLLPDKVAIQLNDTHPAIGVVELLRLLVDEHAYPFERAWELCVRCFAYTNHTLLPEALEVWPVDLFERLLPRHLQLIYAINHRFLTGLRAAHPGDEGLIQRLSLIQEGDERAVRMANLAVLGSHRVNGVAELHARLMRETIFADFARLYPERFIGITNGITPRRWLLQINPGLSRLVTEAVGEGWPKDLERLQGLAQRAEDPGFRDAFAAVKRKNKARLAAYIAATTGIAVNADALFDVQIKRIHEYKRQLLNLLHLIVLYNRLRANPALETLPRVAVFAGKAAPGYHLAKLTIHLINSVADRVNRDPTTGERLRIVFLHNYDVTLAERIIPAAELSEQISTAGWEASGTGNMKLSLNGALTIGTLDGANIEICDGVGSDSFFTFGMSAEACAARLSGGYDPTEPLRNDPRLAEAIEQIRGGFFAPPGNPGLFAPIADRLTQQGEPFLVLADFADYARAQAQVEDAYRNKERWSAMAIRNVAAMGPFSSDRAVAEYAREVWAIC